VPERADSPGQLADADDRARPVQPLDIAADLRYQRASFVKRHRFGDTVRSPDHRCAPVLERASPNGVGCAREILQQNVAGPRIWSACAVSITSDESSEMQPAR
jgi:hypothetical protein